MKHLSAPLRGRLQQPAKANSTPSRKKAGKSDLIHNRILIALHYPQRRDFGPMASLINRIAGADTGSKQLEYPSGGA